jgi:glycerol-3-phosphate dehydrogenase (NAD(P)+)
MAMREPGEAAREQPVCPPVCIIGGGAFGHALAKVARRRGTQVALWSRRGDVDLPEGVARAATLADAARAGSLLFLCVPAAHARPVLRTLGDVVDGGHMLVHAARGFEPSGATVSHIAREETPIRRVGVLAGPLVPQELEAAIPSAIVVASRYPEVRSAAQAALSQEALRVYGSDDLTGVELSAAFMTVIALGAGLVTGLGGGVSTRALMVARGIAQSARLLEAMGAKTRTLAGLGGIGEVFVTAQGVESPDYLLGVALARGADAATALASVGRSCEAPSVARSVARLSRERSVRAPLFGAIVEIVDGRRPPEEALREFFISAPTEI